MLLKEQFAQKIIENPPPLTVELVASDSHESRDLVDPYVQIFDEKLGKIINPSGEIVEETIEKDTYIGSQEHKAFMQMQDLVKQNESGMIVWFSPKYPGKYDISKVLFSEILLTFSQKVILNRSITFDCNDETLLNLANEIGIDSFNNLEELRKTSFLFESDKFIAITNKLSLVTQQVKMLTDNKDLETKLETYGLLLNAMKKSLLLPFYHQDNYYQQLRYMADQEGLIGTAQGSCGGGSTTKETAFEKMSESSQETKLLECKCPFCGKRVFAIITLGSIHCPSCGKSAEYHC